MIVSDEYIHLCHSRPFSPSTPGRSFSQPRPQGRQALPTSKQCTRFVTSLHSFHITHYRSHVAKRSSINTDPSKTLTWLEIRLGHVGGVPRLAACICLFRLFAGLETVRLSTEDIATSKKCCSLTAMLSALDRADGEVVDVRVRVRALPFRVSNAWRGEVCLNSPFAFCIDPHSLVEACVIFTFTSLDLSLRIHYLNDLDLSSTYCFHVCLDNRNSARITRHRYLLAYTRVSV